MSRRDERDRRSDRERDYNRYDRRDRRDRDYDDRRHLENDRRNSDYDRRTLDYDRRRMETSKREHEYDRREYDRMDSDKRYKREFDVRHERTKRREDDVKRKEDYERKDKDQRNGDAEPKKEIPQNDNEKGKDNHQSSNSLVVGSLESDQDGNEEDLIVSVEDKEKEEQRLIEEQREKRRLIMEKYLQSTTDSSRTTSLPTSPSADFSLSANEAVKMSESDISAIDYDPGEETRDRLFGKIPRDISIDSVPAVSASLPSLTEEEETIGQTEERGDQEDEDDMFSENFQVSVISGVNQKSFSKNATANLADNWDDAEGYYRSVVGEIMGEHFVVNSTLGKGVFSTVVKAIDNRNKTEVAIKIVRNNESMYKAGMKELALLQKLVDGDPEDRKHMIRIRSHFEHKNHLCLVFDAMSLNLREVLKRFGRNVGLNIKAIRFYAQQIFLGLSLLRKCNIIHADIKPDNILVNETKNYLRICDLGSASDASEGDITQYLVARFYRAPEIILGLKYDFAIDMWSVACSLYELYTGRILLPGRSNNQMLYLMMELKGRFPSKMLRKGAFSYLHFDEGHMSFLQQHVDKVSGAETVQAIPHSTNATRDFRARLVTDAVFKNEEERRLVTLFADLLEKMTILNPEKRISPREAIHHPFITLNQQ